nr:DUF4405 domain-containing protein [uncultured Desulfobulbus sp.]
MNDNSSNEHKNHPAIPLSRNWVTPLVTGAFLLSALTGILLFFGVHTGLVKWSHEWLSWLFVIAAVFHVALNYRPLTQTVTQPVGKAIMIIFVVLIGLSFLPLGNHKEHGRDHGGRHSLPFGGYRHGDH